MELLFHPDTKNDINNLDGSIKIQLKKHWIN